MIVVPVCKRHDRPGPFLCGFCITDDLICNEVTCDACLKEREDLYDHIGRKSLLTKLSCYLCTGHFNEEAGKIWFTESALSPVKYDGELIFNFAKNMFFSQNNMFLKE